MARTFPSEHPAFVGSLNRDQKYVRRVLSDYDLMFCVGSDVLKMSVLSEVEPLPETTKVVMVGLRDWEMGKNFPAEIALARRRQGDPEGAGAALEEAGRCAARRARQGLAGRDRAAQLERRSARRRKAKLAQPSEKPLPAEWLMMRLSESAARGRHHRRRGPDQRRQPC